MVNVNPNVKEPDSKEYPNPVRKLRERQNATQELLAAELGIGRLSVLRLEQGLPQSPGPSIVRFAVKHYPDEWSDFSEFHKQYFYYQRAKREANLGLLDPGFQFKQFKDATKTELVSAPHPLDAWAFNSKLRPTVTSICVAFCIHLPVVSRFINSPAIVATIPSQMLDALRHSGYTKEQLDTFQESYTAWRNARFNIRPRKG